MGREKLVELVSGTSPSFLKLHGNGSPSLLGMPSRHGLNYCGTLPFLDQYPRVSWVPQELLSQLKLNATTFESSHRNILIYGL